MFDRAMTPSERKRALRPSGSRKKGHAAPPGSGPDGETCGSCAHLTRVVFAKTYLKCGLRRATWTGSYGTDVRAKDSACSKWEGK